MKLEEYIWTEKYRPKTINDIILPNEIKQKAKEWIEQNQIPNLLFVGKQGTGKTSLMKILCNSLNCSYIILNLSDERGIDTVRNKIKTFAITYSTKPIKIVGLDEFDYCTPDGQASLRKLMEDTAKYTRYIITCNYAYRIIDPIKSRCYTIEFKHIPQEDFINYLENICKKEKIEYERSDLIKIMKFNYPDLRQAINVLQQLVKNKKVDIKILTKKIFPLEYIIEKINEKNYLALQRFLIENEFDLNLVANKMFAYFLNKKRPYKAMRVVDEFLKLASFNPYPKILFLNMCLKLMFT